ncbi:hypothetical protein CTheo_1909 [Ceratobasidium theobromae]|uniref:Uncharacterized protein n=1 Tax=Ceratobasidium theobromae TaxID=1582974 RepID=A0A5N5QTP2_9AGAM|nr:hypothetical protein CTheo_1909 [Ceratobasidium theobromae]
MLNCDKNRSPGNANSFDKGSSCPITQGPSVTASARTNPIAIPAALGYMHLDIRSALSEPLGVFAWAMPSQQPNVDLIAMGGVTVGFFAKSMIRKQYGGFPNNAIRGIPNPYEPKTT